MNLTNEQIDEVIAALQAAKKAQSPLEWWCVLDCDGDGLYSNGTRDRAEAEQILAEKLVNGGYPPYRLVHFREVLP